MEIATIIDLPKYRLSLLVFRRLCLYLKKNGAKIKRSKKKRKTRSVSTLSMGVSFMMEDLRAKKSDDKIAKNIPCLREIQNASNPPIPKKCFKSWSLGCVKKRLPRLSPGKWGLYLEHKTHLRELNPRGFERTLMCQIFKHFRYKKSRSIA